MIDKPSAPDNVPSDRSTPSGTVVAITFMLFQTLIVWYAIRDNFFKDDDWLVLYRAEEMGLTWRFLALDVYQHFAPVNRFIYWISQHYAPGSWPLARSLIGACLFLWLVSVWTCCRVARTSLPRTLVALGPVGLSVFTAFPALWFGCAAHVFPAAAGSAFTVALFLWWHRRGGWVPLGLAWFAFAATLLTQERPLIVFPYLLLLHYLVLAPGPLRRIPARVIRDWRIWSGIAAIWVGYFAYFMRVYYGPLPRPRLSQLLGFLVFTIGRFASGLAGLRSLPPFVWRADAIMDDVAGAAAALILAACAGWTIHRNRWNARVWAFFMLAFMGNMAMLGWGRVGVFGIEGVGGNLQYYCDICMLLAWSLALLRLPSDGAPWVPRLAPYPIVRGVLLAACGAALIATNAVSWGGLL